MSQELILQMEHIDKRFDGVHALDDVSFSLKKGEVHALVGENGAGKSTLMKILIGIHSPDKGQIIFEGKPVTFTSIRDALNSGISMIFQELNQVQTMTVMENIFLGREPRNKLGEVDFKKMYNDSAELLEKLGVKIDPRTRIGELSVAKQQLVEIVKAISYNAKIIIMDEPTSALSDAEIQYLLSKIRSLRSEGKSIIYISHKMEEIYDVCDTVTVLRDGHFIHSGKLEGLPQPELIRMMVDRDVNELFPKLESEIGDVVLEAKDLCCKGCFENVNFTLRKGEILGFAGLMGAGRTELMEAIMGLRKLDGGALVLNGQKIVNNLPTEALKNGILMVPEDRKRKGILAKLSVKDNILVSSYDKCVKGGSIVKSKEKAQNDQYVGKLNIKCSSHAQLCANLSGGNQQKVVVSRVLSADPQVIIVDEPTRGIDVKTKSDIHLLISQLAQQGKSIIMVSSELPEVMGMSDRIVVMHEGVVTAVIDRDDATAENIMHAAIGAVG